MEGEREGEREGEGELRGRGGGGNPSVFPKNPACKVTMTKLKSFFLGAELCAKVKNTALQR